MVIGALRAGGEVSIGPENCLVELEVVEDKGVGVVIEVLGVPVSLSGDWVGTLGRRSMSNCLVGVEGEIVKGERGRVGVEELIVWAVCSGLLACEKLAVNAEFGVEEESTGLNWGRGGLIRSGSVSRVASVIVRNSRRSSRGRSSKSPSISSGF